MVLGRTIINLNPIDIHLFISFTVRPSLKTFSYKQYLVTFSRPKNWDAEFV